MSALISILVKGGPVMIPLLACSVLSLTVIIERGWFWWRLRSSDQEAERALQLAGAGKWEKVLHLAEASRSPVARVLAAGIRYRNPSPALAMEAAAQAEVAQMKRYLPILDTIITLAPLLGLLGTVTGMISAFGVIGSSGIGQPHAITGGVAEALIATAAGLLIAIVSLVPYNAFTARMEGMLETIERYGSRVELFMAEARERQVQDVEP